MSDRDPVDAIRAFLFVMPLAILVGSLLSPPDPFSQLALVGVALAVGWPLARRVEERHDLGPRTLGLFYLVVGVVVLVGLWVLSLGSVLGVVALLARVVVVAVALLVAYRFVLARSAR
jgi:hypothetical protein